MSFADEIRTIDPEIIKQEERRMKDEQLKQKKQAEKEYYRATILECFKTARKRGLIPGNVIQGFWGHFHYRYNDGDTTLSLVLCSPESVYPPKPKKGNAVYPCVSGYGTFNTTMNSSLLQMHWSNNEYFSSNEFLSFLKETLANLGFKNIVCEKKQVYYYSEVNGLFYPHFKKFPVEIGYMSCSF